MGHSVRQILRLARENPELRAALVKEVRVARSKEDVPEALLGMRFEHPETGNRVVFLSLPNDMQTELIQAYRKLVKKRQEQGLAPKTREDLPDAEKGDRVWTDKLPPWMRGRQETWMFHFDANPRSGGRPSKERQEFFDRIIDSALADVPSKPEGEREAVFMMGGPGSGKSVARDLLPDGEYVEIDSDSIKQEFPEYRHATKHGRSYRKAAHMVHKESAYISNEMLDRAMEEGKPFVFDRTGVSLRRMRRDIERAKKAGYKVRVMMVDVPREVGRDRVQSRAETSGRYVPDFIIDEAYDLVPGNYLAVAGLADEATLLSGETGDTIYERSGDEETVHDKEYNDRFLKEHKPKPKPKWEPSGYGFQGWGDWLQQFKPKPKKPKPKKPKSRKLPPGRPATDPKKLRPGDLVSWRYPKTGRPYRGRVVGHDEEGRVKIRVIWPPTSAHRGKTYPITGDQLADNDTQVHIQAPKKKPKKAAVDGFKDALEKWKKGLFGEKQFDVAKGEWIEELDFD